MNLKTTFVAANVTLDVVARSTKKSGIAVFLRSKTGKAKAVLGCRSTFTADKEAEARVEYDRLVAETTAKGWKVSATKTGSNGRFTEIPDAPTTDQPGGPVAEPTGAAKKAKDKAAAKAGQK